MQTVTIHLTDAEYASLMEKANAIREHCKLNYSSQGFLRPAKEMLSMCAKLNLERNMTMFSKGVIRK